MFKKVKMTIEVPLTDYCYDGLIKCENLDYDGLPFCKLDLGCLEFDRNDFVKKSEKCRNLEVITPIKKICINCGYYFLGENWCDLKEKPTFTDDSCEGFQYGSWK